MDVPTAIKPSHQTYPKYQFFTRVRFILRVWTLKFATTLMIAVMRILNSSKTKAVLPTKIKRYPSRPDLECRVHLPVSSSPGAVLPLYIDIHGGGFTIGDPQLDDEFCNYFATKHGFCVVSINYRKAPSHPFPTQANDCADLVRAILDDKELCIDSSRVAMGGFSAGGSLTLALAQQPGIKERVKALVPFYPATDWSNTFKGQFRHTKTGQPDLLTSMYKTFEFAYLKPGQDLTNPLLSPIYAGRSRLPQPVFLIGCEYDYLCHEAHIMARMLAGIQNPENIKVDDVPTAWSQNSVKWRTMPDSRHSFTHIPERNPQDELKRRAMCEELYQEIADWLKEEAFVTK